MCTSSIVIAASLALVMASCAPEEPSEEPAPPDTTEPAPTDPDDEQNDERDDARDDDEEETDEVEPGAWAELPEAPIAPRLNHTLTWADGVVIVWGGQDQETFEIAADGAAYDPDTGEWELLDPAPIEGRWAHEAVWTGEELLVWGGTAGPDHLAACYTDGARYDPEAATWEAIPEAPGQTRCGASVVWADDELLVFGGHRANGIPGPDDRSDDGVAFDPATDEWRSIPAAPIEARASAVAVWTGDELVVYGGHTHADDEGLEYRNDGAAYDPATDEWREIEDSPLSPRSGIDGIWIGDELLVFGGDDPDLDDPDLEREPQRPAASYDPGSDTWERLAEKPWPQATSGAVWTESDVLYVLGSGAPRPAEDEPEDAAEREPDEDVPSFMAYVRGEDQWIERPDPPAGPRSNHAMAWTGTQLIVWGGQARAEPAPGVIWDPPAPASARAAGP